MKKYYYLYQTTNISNGRKYIGQRITTKKHDKYFGSSAELCEDIRRGDKYIVEILGEYDNQIDLGHAEYNLIRERNAVNNPEYYNKINNLYINNEVPDERRHRISQSLKGRVFSESHRDNIRKARIGKSLSKETKEKISEKHKNKVVSEETREKLRKALMGNRNRNKGLNNV